MNPINAQQAWEVLQHAELLHTPQQVDRTIVDMASRITEVLAETDPLLICVMTGGVVPFGRILPLLQFPLQIDYVHATRYGKRLQGGQLQWISGPHQDPRDRHVLLIDDILDEGTTLAGIESRYRDEGAREVYKAVLIMKNRPRKNDIHVEFTGLEVPDRYVFGCGMDYKGYLRNMAGIYAEGISK